MHLTDGDHIRGLLARYCHLIDAGSVPLQPIMTGTYVDSFASDEDGWHFTERRFGVGRSGLLDQHLTVDLSRDQP